jgi:hypothetical protein
VARIVQNDNPATAAAAFCKTGGVYASLLFTMPLIPPPPATKPTSSIAKNAGAHLAVGIAGCVDHVFVEGL